MGRGREREEEVRLRSPEPGDNQTLADGRNAKKSGERMISGRLGARRTEGWPHSSWESLWQEAEQQSPLDRERPNTSRLRAEDPPPPPRISPSSWPELRRPWLATVPQVLRAPRDQARQQHSGQDAPSCPGPRGEPGVGPDSPLPNRGRAGGVRVCRDRSRASSGNRIRLCSVVPTRGVEVVSTLKSAATSLSLFSSSISPRKFSKSPKDKLALTPIRIPGAASTRKASSRRVKPHRCLLWIHLGLAGMWLFSGFGRPLGRASRPSSVQLPTLPGSIN